MFNNSQSTGKSYPFVELIFQIVRRKPIIINPELTNLKRNLTVIQVASLGIGSTIGTGIFVVLTENVPKAGPSIIISFILSAIAAGLSALCFAELGSVVPMTGSSYTYVYSTLGEIFAVIIGACLFLEYAVAAAAVSVGWSEYLNQLLSYIHLPQIPDYLAYSPFDAHPGILNLPAVILLIMCGILLLRGASESAKANVIMVIIKLSVLCLFIVVGLFSFHAANLHPFMTHGISGITSAASGIFFSFVGLDTLCTAGEEISEPRKGIPKALIIALTVVVGVYILTSLAAVGSYPENKFVEDVSLASILEDLTGQTWPALIFSIGAIISIFSVTLTVLYGQSRIFYIMSKDNVIPARLSKINPKTKNPELSIYCTLAIVIILAAVVPLDDLADMVSLGTLLAFITIALAVVALRKRKPPISGGYTMPGYPLTPILTIVICLYVLLGLGRKTWIAFGLWIALWFVFYMVWGRKHSALEQNGTEPLMPGA